MSRKSLIRIAILCAVLAIISISFYIWNFANNGLSDSTTDWANFGGFIGGMLGALIGIINVAVLIYISLLISKHDDRRWSYQLIHQAYSELIAKLDELNFSEYDPVKFHEIQLYIYSFAYSSNYLFDQHEKYFSRLCYDFGGTIAGIDVSASSFLPKDIDHKKINLSKLRNRGLVINHQDFDEEFAYESLNLSLSTFEVYRHHLLTFIKQYIMNKNVDSLTKIDLKERAKTSYEEWNKVQKTFLLQPRINLDDWI